MNALVTFVHAAASYYGVPVEQLTEGSGIATDKGDFELVLRFKLEPTDLAGIMQRMQQMRAAEQIAEEQAARVQAMQPEARSDAELRAEYQALPPDARSRYGSFARYKAGLPIGDLTAADFIEPIKAGALPGGPFHTTPEPVELPQVVWLERGEATEQQKAMAIGVDEKGRIGVDPDDLTEEQRKARENININIKGMP